MDPWLLPVAYLVVWQAVLAAVLVYGGVRDGHPTPRWAVARQTRLLIAVALGLAVLAAPTYLALFPSAVHWPSPLRLSFLGAWITAAMFGVYLTAISDDNERVARIRADRQANLTTQFQTSLVPGVGGVPPEYQFTVYVPDPSNQFLFPIYPRAVDALDPAIFPVGVGAAGVAWKEGKSRVAFGIEVSNAQFGLTLAQRRRYRIYRSVAATPIRDFEGVTIGVLTAIGQTDSDYFRTTPGVKAMESVADAISWLVPEAAKWLLPTEEELDGGT